MYKDYKGTVTIDTKDHIISIDKYAESYNLDLEKLKIISITISIVSGNFHHYFKCEEIGSGKKIDIEFSPTENIFSEFVKVGEIILNN